MEGDKSVSAIGFGKLLGIVKNHIERGRMCLHQNVGYDHLAGEIGARTPMTRILVISDIRTTAIRKTRLP